MDGVQAAGKLAVDVAVLGADLYSISGHKLNAPKGIGALGTVRKGVAIKAQLLGGHHERDRRAGTENVPAAVAFGVAAQWWKEHGVEESARLSVLRRDRLESAAMDAIPDVRINGNLAHRLSI